MALNLAIFRMPAGSVASRLEDGYDAFVGGLLDGDGEDATRSTLRLYSEWDCLWFLLGRGGKEARQWDTATTQSILGGAVVGRRLVVTAIAPYSEERVGSEPFDALRWNTAGDVVQISKALASRKRPELPPPGAAAEASVYHSHLCADDASPRETIDRVLDSLDRLRTFYAASAAGGDETLHALD